MIISLFLPFGWNQFPQPSAADPVLLFLHLRLLLLLTVTTASRAPSPAPVILLLLQRLFLFLFLVVLRSIDATIYGRSEKEEEKKEKIS